MFNHELAQNKEQYEGYTVFHMNVKGSDKPIKMMCLTDVKEIMKTISLLEGKEKNLQKLKDLERQLTLIRDDFSAYGKFMERNIRQSKELKNWEESFKDLIDTLNTIDYVTNTEKEANGLKLMIINIVKGMQPNISQD